MTRRSVWLVVVLVLFSIASATYCVRLSASGPDLAVTQATSGQGDRHVRAAGRGWPYVNLRDGVQLPGPGARGAVPFAMASADFDEDGVPDLVAAYGTGRQGFAMIYRGNIDSIHPGTDAARQRKAAGQSVEAPLSSPTDVPLPIAPQLLGAGDFDRDGHADIVAAAEGDSALAWLRGNGAGGFDSARMIAVPGSVTGLLATPMGRPDGSSAVILALTAASTPGILIVHGLTGIDDDASAGTLSDTEFIALPAAAAAMAAGRIDDDGLVDLAVAAGHELLVVAGRDRDTGEGIPGSAAAERVSRRSVPFAPVAAGIGDFVTDSTGHLEIALLSADGALHVISPDDPAGVMTWPVSAEAPSAVSELARSPLLIPARVSSLPGDNPVVVDRARQQIHIVGTHAQREMSVAADAARVDATLDVTGQPVAVLPMRLNGDGLTDLVVLAEGADAPIVVMTEPVHTFTVDDPGDEPDCNPTDSMCRTGPVDSFGVCQGKCTFRAAITEANVQSGFDAIKFDIGSGTPSITRTPGADWKLTEAAIVDGNTGGATRVELNGIGANNVLTVSGGNSTIRNLVLNRGGYGLYLQQNGGNIIEGNYIGTDASGTQPAGNAGYGIEVVTQSNTIGSTIPGAGNVISANGLDGIYVSGAWGTTIIGNYIGTDTTGTVPLGNAGNGIDLINAPSSQVGGTTPGAGNVISGNKGSGALQGGIVLSTTSNSVIQGNFIGTTADGTAALGNAGAGINVRTGSSHLIGGTTASARNVIAGNGSHGVILAGGGVSMQALIQGNRIGTDANGQIVLGNAGHGILIQGAHDNTIGGTTTGAGNVISGNGLDGVHIEFSGSKPANNKILGNLIGTTANGASALGNTGDGVELSNATNTTIGGTTSGAGNVIAANGQRGLYLNASSSLVQGNIIGSDPSGKLAVLGNKGDGVFVDAFQNGNTIGGTTNGSGNTIVFNGGAGLAIAGSSATNHQIRRNAIFGNVGLGIDLGVDGVTANDACDGDAGANMRQNFPVLTSVSGKITIQGTLNSAPNTTFALDFFVSPSADASGYGEGQVFLGSATVTTTASCTAAFSATFSKTVPAGQFLSATATDPSGNTSEFSPALPVPGIVTVTSPDTAVNWAIGSTQTISWDHNIGLGTHMRIEISRDAGSSWAVIAPSVKNKDTNGTFKWVVTGPSTTQARIRVTSTTDATVSDLSDVNFTIASPFVTVTRPNLSTDVWAVGTKQTITWNSNLGSLERVRIDLSTDGGVTYPIVVLSSTPSDGKQAVVVQSGWVSPSARIKVTWLKDATVADASDANFKIQ